MSFDMQQIEKKWQERWEEERLFEVDPDEREKFFIVVAYPYPSGGMHIGHIRTYTLPDVFGRFKRMRGNNVLFPMAWHITGTPIIGAVNRLKEREEKQVRVLRDVYNVPEEDFSDMESAEAYAHYFIENHYKNNMKRLGYGVDWRREFTTHDTHYNKFIEWQYNRLHEQGLVKKGFHPVKFCTEEDNPVTTHDLLEGEDAEKNRYVLVKFSGTLDDRDIIVPTATLRPETVYGVTNIFVDPEAVYVTAEVDEEVWLISESAAEKLQYQNHSVNVLNTHDGRSLVGAVYNNPITGDSVPILPASFVDVTNATGVVMSVPAHAPVDYLALQEAKEMDFSAYPHANNLADRVQEIELISVIDVPGLGPAPAKEAVEEHGVSDQSDPAVKEVTQEVYKKEFHSGKMAVSEFKGVAIEDMKEELVRKYDGAGFSHMYDFSEAVICRCGSDVVISERESWFLTYGDKVWKEKALSCLEEIECIPEETRKEYRHAIDWLESWPCIRNYGLGTRLPFDDRFVIEPLSDSTIYMAYFTIAHLLHGIDADKISSTLFDYVFLGEGNAEDVAAETGIAQERITTLRNSFEYWYPLDYNCSANDLIQNHLTFYLFHHAALFPKEKWTKGSAVWGMGLLEGKKMSSSKGNVITASEAIKTYGSDTVRFYMFSNWEPWQDFDWRAEEVRNYKQHLARWFRRALELYGSGTERDVNGIDAYVLSRLNRIVKNTTQYLDDFQTRKASLQAFFELNNVIDWYKRRAEEMNTHVVNELVETQTRLLSPFIPHLTEEVWERIGQEGFVSTAEWPSVDESAIDPNIEAGEEVVKQTLEDIRSVAKIVDEYNAIKIIISPQWKYEAFQRIAAQDTRNVGEIMGVLKEEFGDYMQELAPVVQDYVKNPSRITHVTTHTQEYETLEGAVHFFSNEFSKDVVVELAEESKEKKARRAEPGKPAIVLT